MRTTFFSATSCLLFLYRFGGAPHHTRTFWHPVNNHRTRTRDRVAAQTHTLFDGGANANPGALADRHAAGQVGSRADVDARCKVAIVVDRRARVDNTCFSHYGPYIDDRAC